MLSPMLHLITATANKHCRANIQIVMPGKEKTNFIKVLGIIIVSKLLLIFFVVMHPA